MPISPINRRGATPVPLHSDAALVVLARHQQRRRQRIPTLTVLAGVDDAPARLVRRFAETEQRPVCEPFSLEQYDAMACWFAACDVRQTFAAAYKWLSGRAVCDPRILSSGMRARSLEEQALFLDRTLGAKGVSPVDVVCRAIVEHAWQFGSIASGLWERLLEACEGDLSRVTAGILALIGDRRTPILYVVARTKEVVALRTIVAKAALLTSLAPPLPMIVSATPERIEEYLATTPECHALAVAREGMVWLAGQEQMAATPDRRPVATGDVTPQPATRGPKRLGPAPAIADLGECVLTMTSEPTEAVNDAAAAEIPEEPCDATAEPDLIAVDLGDCALTLTSELPEELRVAVQDATKEQLATEAPPVATAVDLGDCVLSIEPEPQVSQRLNAEPSVNGDAARSAAERYLFERLQAHPITAGLFELNGVLDAVGGGRSLEVDLLARDTRVAIEIDGYYHFTDWDAYRRDRKKDVLLQLAGFCVVRCLADDVAGRLEEILQTVLSAVRRHSPEQGRAGGVA
jgi:hypothetical protein